MAMNLVTQDGGLSEIGGRDEPVFKENPNLGPAQGPTAACSCIV